jgi:hypothetical protein
VKNETLSAAFDAELAAVLFDTPADPDREVQEQAVVEKFDAWIQKADRKKIWAMALYTDEMIVPILSGKNLLHVARLLEQRAPTVIESMPNLKKHKDHLLRAAELGEILSPRALDRLIAAVGATKSAAAEEKK